MMPILSFKQTNGKREKLLVTVNCMDNDTNIFRTRHNEYEPMCNKPTQCVNFLKTGLVLLKTYISPSCSAKISNLILDIIFVFYCSFSPRSCTPSLYTTGFQIKNPNRK